MIALTPKDEFTYVPKSERKRADPSTFLMKPLSMRDTIEVERWILGNQKGEISPFELHLKILKKSLVGAENLGDEWEEDEDGTVSGEFINRFPADVRSELVNQVWESASVSEEEEGNSD